MRSQIYTADILNLETVTTDEETGEEVRTPTIAPNVEGEPELNIDTIQTLMNQAPSDEPSPDSRLIILITSDLMAGFSTNGLENYFDPIQRVSDIEQGNFGTVLGLQVIINNVSDAPCLAVADVLDQDAGVTIRTFAAAQVKL